MKERDGGIKSSSEIYHEPEDLGVKERFRILRALRDVDGKERGLDFANNILKDESIDLVWVFGEPGVGKSTVITSLAEWISDASGGKVTPHTFYYDHSWNDYKKRHGKLNERLTDEEMRDFSEKFKGEIRKEREKLDKLNERHILLVESPSVSRGSQFVGRATPVPYLGQDVRDRGVSSLYHLSEEFNERMFAFGLVGDLQLKSRSKDLRSEIPEIEPEKVIEVMINKYRIFPLGMAPVNWEELNPQTKRNLGRKLKVIIEQMANEIYISEIDKEITDYATVQFGSLESQEQCRLNPDWSNEDARIMTLKIKDMDRRVGRLGLSHRGVTVINLFTPELVYWNVFKGKEDI